MLEACEHLASELASGQPPGAALARSISERTSVIGDFMPTERMVGESAMCTTGTKSLSTRYWSFLYSDGLTDKVNCPSR